MKKLFLMFTLAVGVSAFGCGSSSPKKTTTPKAEEVKTTEPDPETDPETDPTKGTEPGEGDLEGGGTEEPVNP